MGQAMCLAANNGHLNIINLLMDRDATAEQLQLPLAAALTLVHATFDLAAETTTGMAPGLAAELTPRPEPALHTLRHLVACEATVDSIDFAACERCVSNISRALYGGSMSAEWRINVMDNVEIVVFTCHPVMKQRARVSLPDPTKRILKWVVNGRFMVSSDNLPLAEMAREVLEWLNC